jgi:CheY-like chemotaxis protein
MAVIDTGKGIGKEFLKDQLFHPFSQENPLQTGTGLGLAIVNSIVRSEGVNGKVDVWSAEGMGTEIRVSFDAVVVDEEDDSSSSASINSHQSVAFGSDTSVSIMGFDSSHRGHMLSLDVLSSYACSWHFDIIEGVDADITIIHEDEPHARSQVLKNKAVIFLSGSRRSEITELANKTTKAGGYLHVLYKPIGPSALKHALRGAVSWLEDQSSGTSTGLAPGIIETLERPTVTRNSSDASAESNSTVSELSHKFKSMHNERAPLVRRRSEETEAQTEVRRPAMAPRGLTYHHAPLPRLSRKVSVADSEGSGSGSPASTLSTISLADGGVMLKAAALAPGVSRGVKGPRVLVVEDNAINRKVLGAFLGKRGYEWSEAHDGQEGVDVFTATPHGHWE